MRGYLRTLGGLLLVVGLVVCAVAVMMAIRDETFFKAGEALGRHPENLMFKSEYYEALIWHMAYLFVALVTGMMGVLGSAMFFGLHAVLRRLDQLEAAITRPR